MGTAPARTRQPFEDPAAEQDALNRVVRSEVLDRAPNLVQFLRYVCEMQLAGRQEAIKEYNIAVEASGGCQRMSDAFCTFCMCRRKSGHNNSRRRL